MVGCVPPPPRTPSFMFDQEVVLKKLAIVAATLLPTFAHSTNCP
jgi:hypothetical protein